jgi:hypothetical protein
VSTFGVSEIVSANAAENDRIIAIKATTVVLAIKSTLFGE